ncbi:acyl-CoA dehydrogenase family protein [Amycolatopsis jejuensis]|uniref:acyl-CoA dehydrogenase family protein n=1 Tax=Amycolatopsis jejuensis TaxID=330084 RepID=UPI000524C1C0|nr:acyl-CoA dehydrogenase family protein [Amycolatopsis jejuensis]
MDFGLVELTPAQQAFQREARAFFDEIVTDEVLEEERETGAGFNLDVHLALAARGWLTPEWPVGEGGAGLDPVCCRILHLELVYHQVPRVTAATTRLVWQAAERYLADPRLRAEVKAGVANGTVRMCLGYTDPDGGSDVAGARLKAVRDGDEWVLNGAKTFTTGAQNCQYTFLVTRTDPERPKHRGLTMFLVPLDSPGVEIQAIRTFGGERTNMVYYDGVRVADRYRLGEVNEGWTVLRGPLDEEHGMAARDRLADLSMGQGFLRTLEPAFAAALTWAATPAADGTRPADDPAVLARLGQIATGYEAALGTPGPMGRVKGAETLIAKSAELIDLVGPQAVLQPGAPGLLGDGALDFAHRFAQGTTIYGGTVEVFRNIIAQHVLKLPRPSYPGAKQFLGRPR